MELMDITEVYETDRFDVANEYLGLGWSLLQIYTTTYDQEGPMVAHQTPHYILGWGDALNPPVRPAKKDISSEYSL